MTNESIRALKGSTPAQPVQDEREAFNAEYERICNRPISIREISWRMWQARAALQSPASGQAAVPSDAEIMSLAHETSIRLAGPAVIGFARDLLSRFAAPAVAVPDGYKFTRRDDLPGWVIEPQAGESWVVYESTPGGQFIAAMLAAAPTPPAALVRAFRDYLSVHEVSGRMNGHAMDDMALDLARIALRAQPAATPAAVQPDAVRHDADWIQGPYVTDTMGRGWCVRIDGTDVFEDLNQYGCKGRVTFQIADGLPDRVAAEQALRAWLAAQAMALKNVEQEQAAPSDAATERALHELVDKIVPGLDTGDLLADAATASNLLDYAQPAASAEPVAQVVTSVPHLRSIVVRAIPGADIPPPDALLYTAPVAAQAQQDERMETTSEHIARDIREGRFPQRSEPQRVQATEWGPMPEASTEADAHVAVVEGDEAVRELRWNSDVAAFAYPVGTRLYAAKAQQDAEDAARYRWLRDRNDWHAEPRINAEDGTKWSLTFYTPAPILDPTDDDNLDNALIAAMLEDAAGNRARAAGGEHGR